MLTEKEKTELQQKIQSNTHGVFQASCHYRVLKEHNQLAHRGQSKAKNPLKKPTTYIANNPNEVWRWDISY